MCKEIEGSLVRGSNEALRSDNDQVTIFSVKYCTGSRQTDRVTNAVI